jgi:LysR family hydrogen peroxide-inducible transcriptional activator
MELHQLRYFCAVARTGSFTRAAEEEGVAQPTLSQQVKRLEDDLGLPLFERRGRSVRLTAGGELLLPQARGVLRQLSDARRSVLELRGGVRGRLVVGSIPTITPYLLAPRVQDFQAQFPEVQLHLVENLTARLVEGLQAGDIDVAVLSLPLAQPDLICSEILRERLLLALPEGHPLAAAREVDARDVRDQRMLVLREGHCFREEALRVCRRARLRVGDVFESDQFASIFALVAAGFGISVVPEMAAPAAAGCSLAPLRGGVRRIGYAQIKRPFVPPAQKAFTGWLRESVGRRKAPLVVQAPAGQA